MRRLSRYILWDLTAVFSVTLAGMTLLLILVGVAQEAVRQGLGPTPVVRLIPYVLPDALRFAVPGTILFAVCSVYGRMSAANEVVAIKALGVSPMAAIWPALLLSFAVSLVAVWLNDVAVSWGRKGVHRVVLQSIEQIVYGMLRTQRAYSTDHFSINVLDVNDRILVRPTLSFFANRDAAPFTLTAREAELHFDAERDQLTILLRDTEISYGDSVAGRIPGEHRQDVPLSIASRKGEITVGPSDCPLRQIPSQARMQRATIAELEQTMAAEAGFQLLTGEFEGLWDPVWSSRRQRLHDARVRLFRLQTEPWRRWANGFSCFFFVLVGAPLAIRLRNADFWTTFGICFLPILIVYYPLLAFGVDRAKSGELPPYCVWLGNLILLLCGLILIGKVKRY